MTIADKIKQYRIEHELTQMQFAEKSGLTRVLVNAIENGYNANPTLDTLQGIAKALEVTIDELVDSD